MLRHTRRILPRGQVLSSSGSLSRLGGISLSSSEAASSSTATQLPGRDYAHFDNFEVKDGVGIVRLNAPGKMNVINQGMFAEAKRIFDEKILPNKDVQAIVFISSKPDNFIAGKY